VTTLYKKEIMAVNVDTVYQRVLTIANKEQRGYITPQEFNLLATQAQLEIFEQYFYDINQFNRINGNQTEYSDMLNILGEKISPFEKWKQSGTVSDNEVTLSSATPNPVYRLGTVFYANGALDVEVELVNKNELVYFERSCLTKPNADRPIYVRKTDNIIKVFPTTLTMDNVTFNYVAKPSDVKWGYEMINATSNEALYNASKSTNFELTLAEETNLVVKILELAGITIKDPGLYQISDKEETETTQQEKQ
jgi:hypothetical protein